MHVDKAVYLVNGLDHECVVQAAFFQVDALQRVQIQILHGVLEKGLVIGAKISLKCLEVATILAVFSVVVARDYFSQRGCHLDGILNIPQVAVQYIE